MAKVLIKTFMNIFHQCTRTWKVFKQKRITRDIYVFYKRAL